MELEKASAARSAAGKASAARSAAEKAFVAVIVAAGKGMRMGGSVPKQYLDLCGMPVLTRTLLAFEKSKIANVIVVCPPGDEDYIAVKIVGAFNIKKVKAIVAGGKERFDSCRRGIEMAAALLCKEDSSSSEDSLIRKESGIAESGIILVHDGVRALVSEELINKVITELETETAVCPATCIKETIRTVDESGYGKEVIERATLRSIQTPQGFRANVLMKAYERYFSLPAEQRPFVTDDAMLVELYGGAKVKLIEGEECNIKLTTPFDLEMARHIV